MSDEPIPQKEAHLESEINKNHARGNFFSVVNRPHVELRGRWRLENDGKKRPERLSQMALG